MLLEDGGDSDYLRQLLGDSPTATPETAAKPKPKAAGSSAIDRLLKLEEENEKGRKGKAKGGKKVQ